MFWEICSGKRSGRKTLAKRVRRFQEDIYVAVNYALFFLDNGYVGLAYHTCQKGDQLYLLAGSDWPFILRQDGDAFWLVAPAYVHGVMEGQLWPDDESELEQIMLV